MIQLRLPRPAVFGALPLIILVALACGSSADAPDDTVGSSEPTVSPTATAAVTPTATVPAGDAVLGDYDSQTNMFLLFSGEEQRGDATSRALQLALQNSDKSMVPVVLELMRFLGDSALIFQSLAFLSDISGQDMSTEVPDWKSWVEWYGQNREEYQPPAGYVEWKANLLSLIDPRFRDFLLPHGKTAKIDLTEVMWGGVRPDGIPDLQFVPVLTPDEATYLQPSDRVFGVSINGEHRAYPLRIINAHEMANDTLGGEPIALAY